ncbi:MAG: hypothetical protein HQL66_04685, partial [Magnetococcales bacterium]|nr:hypothetical protein [Magnetococcales bacterium]
MARRDASMLPALPLFAAGAGEMCKRQTIGCDMAKQLAGIVDGAIAVEVTCQQGVVGS